MGSKEIRVPYRHLEQEAQIEMSSISVSPESNSRLENGQATGSESNAKNSNGLRILVLGSMIAAGVQFGWALQLSLLTPYIQTLGIGHQFSSFIWLCGPITGLVVQPIVGVWSDKCQSIYGRRRPFIFSGALMICFAVTLIGFSADIGYLLGDTHESCNTYKGTRPRAAVVFVIGFWMLDLANNTVGGPARALLADLSGSEQRNFSNAIYTSWLAFGNILGFSAGASGQWHRWFPFLTTKACCEACGNLKAAFMVAVLSWFPFFLFDTDWMGREVYHGDPKGNATEAAAYQKGVQEGAFGLLLNSVVLGVSSFLIDPLCRWRGSKDLWAASNFIVFVCMASTAVISAYAVSEHHKGIQYMIGNVSSVKAASVALFALLGFPLAITYSIPFSVTAELTADAGGGQGLATGVLNLAIVIPQIVVALGAGPWDALFGGGNVPAFVLAALFALAAGIIAVMKLPNLSSTSYKPAVVHGFG
ncbi:sucrose transport protein SUT4 isoform X3 [Cryptomeria japonica]|uniref:sucrose transport protein SUT4 isoform X3 n=1 Tax=Cryptomeria japonica TaxID=3369 RepID=UPI0027DA6A5C|nr:sucrose transport protein SUT4 isoform X3 [Cryptomeria japonica]